MVTFIKFSKKIGLYVPASLVSVYREVNKKDGFVITAFYTSHLKQLLKKEK
jgi:hypothetical protein